MEWQCFRWGVFVDLLDVFVDLLDVFVDLLDVFVDFARFCYLGARRGHRAFQRGATVMWRPSG
jgi:hypothetical protein